MSENKQTLKRSSEKSFALDRYMALHQRKCYLIVALIAVLGALAIWKLAPSDCISYCAVGLAIILMLLYRYISKAAGRAMLNWALICKDDPSRCGEMLQYLNELDRALPEMQKWEMAYLLTVYKASCLHRLDRTEEAISLLRGFDKIWDQSQRYQLNRMIANFEAALMRKQTKEGN